MKKRELLARALGGYSLGVYRLGGYNLEGYGASHPTDFGSGSPLIRP